MVKKVSTEQASLERRKQWRDRRSGEDRRNPQRLKLVTYDCRSGKPRRQSDITGEFRESEISWKDGDT